jgi:hypothetical protein
MNFYRGCFDIGRKELAQIIESPQMRATFTEKISKLEYNSKIEIEYIHIPPEYIFIEVQTDDALFKFWFSSLLIKHRGEYQSPFLFGEGKFYYSEQINKITLIDKESLRINIEYLLLEEINNLQDKYNKRRGNFGIPIIEGSNIFIHEYDKLEEMEGEKFELCKNFEDFEQDENCIVEVSNKGRIKWNNKIQPQWFDERKGECVLKVKEIPIHGGKKEYGLKIHRLVAATFLPRYFIYPNTYLYNDEYYRKFYVHVHHKNNNGYDSRIENLLWVTRGQHKLIQLGHI